MFQKIAELGGDGQDTKFEQAFSNLAHTYLKDKAPTLQQYEVGFQLLDRNQDNTKAVGIFGFKVGSQWIYSPVFFLNGDLKGHELLYLKNQDQFIPLKENWINYVLNRRPGVLGDTISRNSSNIGVQPPDLQAFSEPPNKYSSHINKDLLPGASAFAYFSINNPLKDSKYKNNLDIPTFLKKEGSVINLFIEALKRFPKTAEAIKKTYGSLDFIKEAIEYNNKKPAGVLKEAEDQYTWGIGEDGKLKKKRKKKNILPSKESQDKNALLIYTMKTTTVSIRDDLSQEEKEKLLNDGLVVKDNREEASQALRVKIDEGLNLINPTETGVYDLLVKPGTFEKHLVIIDPHSDKGREEFAVVIRLDGQKNWLNCHPAYLWCKQRDIEDYNYNKFLSNLDSTTLEVTSTYPRNKYVIVGPKGQGTVTFEVDTKLTTSDGKDVYNVWFDRYSSTNRPGALPELRNKYHEDYFDIDISEDPCIHFTQKNGLMRTLGRTVYVPKGFKVIKVKGETDNLRPQEEGSVKKNTDPPPILPGTTIDLQRAIFDKTASLEVYGNNTDLQINGKRFDKLDGLVHLIQDFGLREKTAKELIKEANQKGVCKCRIKFAFPMYNLQESAPAGPGIMGDALYTQDNQSGGAPAQIPYIGEVPVDMPMGDRNLDIIYNREQPMGPDYNSIGWAMEMARSGQKEVMDASVISSLLKIQKDDNMIDKHLPKLFDALDAIGRVLFQLYANGEAFEDRYGAAEMVSLEDQIRTVFEGLGDLLIDLKEKSVKTFDEELEGDLISAM